MKPFIFYILLKMTNTKKTDNIVEYTNKKLQAWYSNAKQDYGIIWSGYATYEPTSDKITIHYTENGISSSYDVCYVSDEAIDYAFNVWCEQAE